MYGANSRDEGDVATAGNIDVNDRAKNRVLLLDLFMGNTLR